MARTQLTPPTHEEIAKQREGRKDVERPKLSQHDAIVAYVNSLSPEYKAKIFKQAYQKDRPKYVPTQEVPKHPGSRKLVPPLALQSKEQLEAFFRGPQKDAQVEAGPVQRGIKRRQIGDVRFIATQIAKAAQARKGMKRAQLGRAAQKELNREYGEPRIIPAHKPVKTERAAEPFRLSKEAPDTEGPTTGGGLQETLPSALSVPGAFEGALEDLKSNIRGSRIRPPIPNWKEKVGQIRERMPPEPLESINPDDILSSPLATEEQKALFRPKLGEKTVDAYLRRSKVSVPNVDEDSEMEKIKEALRKSNTVAAVKQFTGQNPNTVKRHMMDYFETTGPQSNIPGKSPKLPEVQIPEEEQAADDNLPDILDPGFKQGRKSLDDERLEELTRPTTNMETEESAAEARTGFYPRQGGVPVQSGEQDERILRNYIPPSRSENRKPAQEFDVTPPIPPAAALRIQANPELAETLKNMLGKIKVRRYREGGGEPSIKRVTESGAPAVSFTPRKPVPKGRLPQYGKSMMMERLPVARSIPQNLRQTFAEMQFEPQDRPTESELLNYPQRLRNTKKLAKRRAALLAETRARGQASLQAGKLKALIEHLQKTGGIR